MAHVALSKVLVIDPDVKHVEKVKHLLSSRYFVTGAHNLTAADALLHVYIPPVILLELNEPDGDGVAWIRAMRQITPGRNLVIACVSSRSSVRDKVLSFQAGADDYIVKPINPQTFLAHIILLQKIRQLTP